MSCYMNISNSVLLITVRSSRADKKFDTTVGHIEDIIMGMSCKIHIEQQYYNIPQSDQNIAYNLDTLRKYDPQ